MPVLRLIPPKLATGQKSRNQNKIAISIGGKRSRGTIGATCTTMICRGNVENAYTRNLHDIKKVVIIRRTAASLAWRTGNPRSGWRGPYIPGEIGGCGIGENISPRQATTGNRQGHPRSTRISHRHKRSATAQIVRQRTRGCRVM